MIDPNLWPWLGPILLLFLLILLLLHQLPLPRLRPMLQCLRLRNRLSTPPWRSPSCASWQAVRN